MPQPKYSIDIGNIKVFDETQYSKQTKNINSTNNEFTKRILVLKEEKTSEDINSKDNNSEYLPNTNSLISFSLNDSSYLNYSDTNESKSTFYDSTSQISINNSIIEKEMEKDKNKFNLVRANYYIKYKLNDITLNIEYINLNTPPKYKISDKCYAFLYPNEPVTYCITITNFLKTEKINVNPTILQINNNSAKFFSIYGLYFCGKNIEIKKENETHIKQCAPNSFICNECMDLNKKLYNIKDKYMININGRVSKINKGSYHCFGHFLCGNQIEDCIVKFTCSACKLLNYFLDLSKK
jgi:hypothetical protein